MSVPQDCPTRVSHKCVPQECPTRVTHKSVLQECPVRVSHKSVSQECPATVSHKSVSQELVLQTVTCEFWRKSRAKRSFWRLDTLLLEEVSNETLVLETWHVTLGGSLIRNGRFGVLTCDFWRKSRTKSALQECPTRVSYKSVPQVSYKSIPQEFRTTVSHKSVP